jgi:hypothetical protein
MLATGTHIISALIGLVLILGTVTVWLSQIWPAWRKKAEYIFLHGRNMFANGEPYSGTVTFFKWWTLVPGALLLLPLFVLVDLVLVLIAVWLWRYFVKQARKAIVNPS